VTHKLNRFGDAGAEVFCYFLGAYEFLFQSLLVTLRHSMSSPSMSWPMQCPKPHHAPSNDAFTELIPKVRGVRACIHSLSF